MSKYSHSLRWRLQVWHTGFLVLVVLGLLITDYRLRLAEARERATQELAEQASVLISALSQGGPRGSRRGGRPPDRPTPQLESPRDGTPDAPSTDSPRNSMGEIDPGFPPPPRGEPPGVKAFMLTNTGSGRYAAVWSRSDREISRSSNAPSHFVLTRDRNQREWVKESNGEIQVFRSTPPGEVVGVGSTMEAERLKLRNHMGKLVLGGGGLLCLGIIGGWVVAGRAIRPIQDISEAATRIARGDMSQRIATQDHYSELGELVGVLNSTFEKLEEVFTHQARFTTDAAHELRTPVSIMLAQTQSALMRERSAEEYRETIESCSRAAKRMHQLIESLLALAKLEAGQDSANEGRLNLATIAREIQIQFEPLVLDRLIRIELTLRDAFVEANPTHITQIFSNLVANAIFYNRERGVVRIKVFEEGRDSVLVVEDEGRGIPESEIPKLFTRFHRVDRARNRNDGGTGLGLAITKSIIAHYGGTIEVASQVGRGTTFTVKLPNALGKNIPA